MGPNKAGAPQTCNSGPMPTTTIYTAKHIRTLWNPKPVAQAIAVREGRILGVGTIESLSQWGEAEIDERFAESVIVPGFVEAHAHCMDGAMWNFPYVGFFDRTDPDGNLWEGCKTLGAVVERLQAASAARDADPDDDGSVLFAWGLDPIYFDDERLSRHHLDAVCESRTIFVFHASAHLATVNTAMLTQQDIGADHPADGVPKGDDGYPTGELQEPAAMSLAMPGFKALLEVMSAPASLRKFAKNARNAGVTTVADLGTIQPRDWPTVEETTADPYFPVRLVLAYRGYNGDDVEAAAMVKAKKADSTDRLRFGLVKLVLDGSIQGYTARLNWPHYLPDPAGKRATNGLWLIPPEALADCLAAYHDAGLLVHCHTNGDEALDVFLDAVAEVLDRNPRVEHRFTAQHAQLGTRAQFDRMAALGMNVNLFSNHLWFWGDQHRTLTVGEDRAAGMNACRSALDAGVGLSFHSDAPITPLGPLHTMWCAVNRLTPSGVVLGPDERITAAEALEAATLGAAYQLGMDKEVGSLQPGKRADFTVLNEDPLGVDPVEIKHIEVKATVLSGVVHDAGAD